MSKRKPKPPEQTEPKIHWCRRISKTERRARQRIRDKVHQLRAEMGLPPHPVLDR